MTEDKKHIDLEAPELQKKEVEEVLKFVMTNGKPILIGLGIAIVIFLGFSTHKHVVKSKAETASQVLGSARSIEQLQVIMNQFSDTAGAPVALLEIAARNYHASQYESARMKYQEFQTKYPEHMMYPTTELGIAYCQEALMQLEEADLSYDAFIKKYPDHILNGMAVFGKGRVLEQKGQLTAAKAIYEDFIAENEESIWLGQAEVAVKYIDRKLRSAESEKAAAENQ